MEDNIFIYYLLPLSPHFFQDVYEYIMFIEEYISGV